ncbi:branched-chain amino acid ABC transporter, permease protein [Aeromicrobium marinum DSM 15272]|uniref:Branched-chain amino acid ABC transporter, permease protein n=1 Tax=Aeromicrobium marinum DSM 15272 TaxID=585531 RepID=E2SFT9_9ACTN|nr:branched-chain amino acid ABC transporter, permease protein [Aeromicrobium marinum DSM 15272]
MNQSSMLALSAFAAAIGFRMGLFNIGVEGQYIVAACAAGFFGGAGLVPGPLNILATLVVAVVAGGLYASIAGILKVTRGVSEVISAIMLNYIALTMAGYLVQRYGVESGLTFTTTPLPPSSQPLGFGVIAGAPDVWALTVVALAVGAGYWFLLSRTRFGFDLRVAGESPTAALASGVSVPRMVLISMALSGAIAGLVWMPAYFGSVQKFGIPENFQAGLGFTGLAVALLGRNRVVGIFFGAVLFAFLAAQSNGLQREGIAKEVVDITQGIVVLAVVVAYEVVRRRQAKAESERVARELATEREAVV